MLRRSVLVFAILLSLSALAFFQLFLGQRRLERSDARHEGNELVELAARTALGELDSLRSDLQFLAGLNSLRAFLDNPSERGRKRLQDELRSFMWAKDVYEQLRLIGTDGLEEVRVQQAGDAIRALAPHEMQYKGDRPYFTDALELDPGNVYVSPLDLNVEYGLVQEPYKPMIRFATPVIDTSGRKRGVLVLNYLASRLIGKIKDLERNQPNPMWLVNASGYWLIGPTAEYEWGFMLPERSERRFSTSYPEAWKAIHRHSAGQFRHDGELYTYVRVDPVSLTAGDLAGPDPGQRVVSGDREWVFIEHRKDPYSSLADPSVQRLLMLFGLVVVVMAGVSVALAYLMERRHQAEVDKRIAQERYAELVANLKVGICRLEQQGDWRIVEADRALLRLVGAERAEALVGQPFEILFSDTGQWKHLLGRLEREESLEREVFELRTLGGRRFWAAITAQIRQGMGTAALEVILSDVTERKRAEDALRLSEERHRNLVDGSIMGILVHRDFRPLYANKAYAEIYGFTSPQEVLSLSSVESLVDPEFLDEVREMRAKAMRQDTSLPYFHRFRGIRKDGKPISVEAIAQVVDWDDGKAHQITLIDVTEKVRLEAQLRQAQKMEAVGQLAGGVAHDFNNMLQVMRGYSELAVANVEDQRKTRRHLKRVLEAVDSASQLTTQLLAYSRQQVLRPQNVDLNKLLSNQLKMLRRLIGENIELSLVPAEGLGSVHADPGMLQQIFMNLCINARDAMPDGGRLVLETSMLEADAAFCRIYEWAKSGMYVVVSVSDTGSGIPYDLRERIFEPFFTTKDPGKGTGLGLSTVYGIVRQHEGMIHLYSEVDMGTTFRIYLPVSSQETAEVLLPAEEELPTLGGDETLLIAEDDARVRELMVEMLKDKGYQVLTASDGEEAVDLFKSHVGEIDLVVLDVIMPKLSGRNVYDRIKEVQPSTPVLFSTGYTQNVIDSQFMAETAVTLVQKPYAPSELFRTVRRLLDQRPGA